MDIRAQILSAHSRANADLVLNYVLDDKGRVKPLMKLFLGEEYRVAQRLAMVVGDLGRFRPAWLHPWHEPMIAAANAPLHDSVKRNVLRYFSELPLGAVGEEQEGELLDVAFRLFESPLEAVAIRVYGMQIVANYAEHFPELKDELRAVIEITIAEGATPGFRSRGQKILKRL